MVDEKAFDSDGTLDAVMALRIGLWMDYDLVDSTDAWMALLRVERMVWL